MMIDDDIISGQWDNRFDDDVHEEKTTSIMIMMTMTTQCSLWRRAEFG